MSMMSGRHLILGTLTDFLTGRTVPDTHDERLRQKIARFLVEGKGFLKAEIDSRIPLNVTVEGDTGIVPVDFLVRPEGIPLLLVIYGPGSLVSRQRGTLAAARLLEPYIIPYAAITSGEDAIVMETKTGKVIGEGLADIFSRKELLEKTAGLIRGKLAEPRRKKESRILFAMDVLTRRECESYTCKKC